MGHWGVKSYENDAAWDALDAAFDRVHGPLYEQLMDDRSPLTIDQVHLKLANSSTLAEAVAALRSEFGDDLDAWDEIARLALIGVVVRHAESRVPIPDDLRARARSWLDEEDIEWQEATLRRLRIQAERAILDRAGAE